MLKFNLTFGRLKENRLIAEEAAIKEHKSLLNVQESSIKSRENELDVKSKRWRQKLMTLAILSTHSKIRSSLLTRTIMQWWRVTSSERNRQHELDVEKVLKDGITQVQESRRKFENDQKDANRYLLGSL